jgi:hypothetical protein
MPIDSRLITCYCFAEKRVGDMNMPSAIVRFQIRNTSRNCEACPERIEGTCQAIHKIGITAGKIY